MRETAHRKEKMKEKNKKELTKAKKMSLDDIESEMEELARNTDVSKVFMCSQRMDLLEKVANFKIKKMQLEINKEVSKQTSVQPITVNFTSSNNEEQKMRIERIENSVKEARGVKEDA